MCSEEYTDTTTPAAGVLSDALNRFHKKDDDHHHETTPAIMDMRTNLFPCGHPTAGLLLRRPPPTPHRQTIFLLILPAGSTLRVAI